MAKLSVNAVLLYAHPEKTWEEKEFIVEVDDSLFPRDSNGRLILGIDSRNVVMFEALDRIVDRETHKAALDFVKQGIVAEWEYIYIGNWFLIEHPDLPASGGGTRGYSEASGVWT